jgi:hypothetical protein
MMKRISIYLTLLGLFAISACETTEKIDDFPLRPSKLVVNCFFSPGSPWNFQVSKSLSVLDNAELRLIKDATVRLYRDGSLIESIEEQDEYGWYSTDSNLPETGHEYSIEVTASGFSATLTSEDRVPEPIVIDNVTMQIVDSSFYYGWDYISGWIEGQFSMDFKDPADIDNYYKVSVFYYDTIYYDWENPDTYYLQKTPLYISSDDPVIEAEEYHSEYLIFTDELINGQEYSLTIDFEDWNSRLDRSYYLELTTLNRSGYMYRKTIDDFNNAEHDPFAEPVQIYCNIENGYGIFAGHSTHVYVYNWYR